MPIAATKHSAAGAKAFAKFFLQTIDWGYATTSSTYMRRYYRSGCDQCRFVRAALDNARRDNQHYVGGRLTNIRSHAVEVGGRAAADYTSQLVLDITAGELVNSRGKASHPDIPHAGYSERVGVRWTSGRWAVVYIKGTA